MRLHLQHVHAAGAGDLGRYAGDQFDRRHREHRPPPRRGDDPKQAADRGTAEVALPVFASAMTNVVVFGPIAAMSSLVGRFLIPFAVTMTIATLVSLFVSFTLTPILAAQLLRRETAEAEQNNLFARIWNRGYSAVAGWFGRSLDAVCRHGLLTVLAALALFLFALLYIAPPGRHDLRSGRRSGGVHHQA
ncbi:MAG: efflux RND transporter permease subunit [Lentisphaeria bacterium]|nr:MAG: efflux RND transporter permease subunit [Lentisphaeria bacterium]